MATTKEIGDRGEQLAVDYLIKKGYCVKEKSYRFKRAEIDIIGSKEEVVVFIEVKFRTGIGFGFPEEVVGEAKKELIYIAAENYVVENGWNGKIRFDIISIIERFGHLQIDHFEDAF